MKGKAKLSLKLPEFEELHAILNHTKRTTKEVKVPRRLLDKLLRDHSEMAGTLDGDVVHPTKEG
ncbi:hypothetical protein KAJ83_01495 [Marivibrio halodurans]|uniref:Uncharacterized protein n=1 Tax=Marivibrio halodurans TaxID=2039722 RepID=A0A8J7SKQ4_9PROT|nr:hypothetical protein [Marivibrio halodurans]MBP5855666.1 hypothetical protein [Marivibrio halodurans]